MDPVTSHAIDVVEAAYDLEASDTAAWLAHIMEVGEAILDHGLGLFGFEFVRPSGASGAEATVRHMHTRSMPDDFVRRFEEARSVLSPEFVRSVTPPGHAGSWSELGDAHPKEFRALLDALGFTDILGILAIDPNGVGLEISAPLPDTLRLTPKSRERWQMLGAHIAAGYRLRRAALSKAPERRRTELPYDAEAVFDAKGLKVVEAVGQAQEPTAADVLRRGARRVDRARSALRHEDPERALAAWRALISGRWSVVDWFDTDRRRFVLAIPNTPEIGDPRGLTEQECQVVTYAVLGETNKLIAYRLGLSQGRVSGLLRSALKKLALKSRAQLVRQIGPLGVPDEHTENDSAA